MEFNGSIASAGHTVPVRLNSAIFWLNGQTG
jgi:hypothetical protein